jgi:RNA polymerase sigma-70 factor (ECF subfamily)
MVCVTRSSREEFVSSADPHRRELLAHCYRMLGSVTDAEDAVQETYLNAWRAYETFEGRSSVRAWLYQIATRVCLRALERERRRPLPSGLGAPSADSATPLLRRPTEVPWLEPIPDALVADTSTDPAVVLESRQDIRLALIAALQYLRPQQRAVLILRDVLTWRADEVAGMLGTTTAAVNSMLQRARARLAQTPHAQDELVEPADPTQRETLDRWAAAFEDGDMTALMRLMREDVSLEMPPIQTWFAGRQAVVDFLTGLGFTPGQVRSVPAGVNGQPGFVWYMRGDDGVHRAHSVQVLTLTRSGVARVVAFLDPGLVRWFGLPDVLPPGD